MDEIKCPNCNSTKVTHKVIRDDNGIIGPGFYSWIKDEYYLCNNCGIRFEDIKNHD